MKFLLVGVLLLASVAFIKAEFEDDLIEEDGAMDKCRAERDACLKAAGGDFKKKLECYMKFRKCLLPLPSLPPRPTFRPRPTIPDFFVKCRQEQMDCLKKAGGDFKKKMECIAAFTKCLIDNRPGGQSDEIEGDALLIEEDGAMDKCRTERDACLKAAGGDFKKRLECYMKFRKCRPRPSRRPRPSFRPRPTRPDYVVKCQQERGDCLKKAGDDFQKKMDCIVAFAKCVRDNRPDGQSDEIESDPRRPRPSGRPSRRPRPSGRPSRRPRPSGRPSRRPRPSGRPSRRPHP